MVQKRLLYRMQLAILLQPFNGRDLIHLVHHRKAQARIHPPPIHMNRTRAALPMVTALLRAKHLQVLAQRIQQRHTRLQHQLVIFPIHPQHNRNRAGNILRNIRRVSRSLRHSRRMGNGSSRSRQSRRAKLGEKRSPGKSSEGKSAGRFIENTLLRFRRRIQRGITRFLHWLTPVSNCPSQYAAVIEKPHAYNDGPKRGRRSLLKRYSTIPPASNTELPSSA